MVLLHTPHGLSFIARGSSVKEKYCPLRDMPYSSKARHAMKPSTAVLSGVNWYLFTHDDFYIPQALELEKAGRQCTGGSSLFSLSLHYPIR